MNQKKLTPSALAPAKKFKKDWIIYEDEDFLVLNKPNTLATIGSKAEDSLYRRALEYVKNREQKPLYAAHRLDLTTSGVVLFVKHYQVLKLAQGLFEKRKVAKEYLALCEEAALDLFDLTQWDGNVTKHLQIVTEDGRKWLHAKLPLYGIKNNSRVDFIKGIQAETLFTIERQIGDKVLLRCRPRTGRFHQIRVHLSFLGAPIVGDELYNGGQAHRIYLHASTLSFQWPITKKKFRFEAPMPEKFLPLDGPKKKVIQNHRPRR